MSHLCLKGWIPQYLIDKALSGVLITFFEKVANYVSELRKNDQLSV